MLSPRSLVLCLVLAGCSGAPSTNTLRVDLRTDFVPGVEFDGVSVSLGEGDIREEIGHIVNPGRNYLRGVALGDLSPGTGQHIVEVGLFQDGVRVIARTVSVVVQTSLTVATVVITRDCRGVMCPGDGDPLLASCLGGRCADPRCTVETPEFCPEGSCFVDGDCPPLGCGAPICAANVCLYSPDDSACEAGLSCDLDRGCVVRDIPDASMPDASMPDASMPDASMPDASMPDAGDDAGIADAGMDAGRVDIRCAALAPVSPTLVPTRLIEPGMRSDGLEMVIRAVTSELYAATRPSVGAPFSEWEVTMGYDSIGQDQSFIDFMGEEIGAGVAGPTAGRYLLICRPFDTGPCRRLDVFDEGGALIADDHDGPSLAVRAGELFLAFSRGPGIYIARPRAADLVEWDAEPVDMGPGVFDDPALTDDGAILLASGPANSLVVATWDETAGTYVDPRPVVGLPGGSVEIGVETASGFELFVNDDTRGGDESHRTTCTF